MNQSLKLKYLKAPGTAPGSLHHVGEKKAERTRVRLIRYDQQSVEEKEFGAVEECLSFRKSHGVKWINIDGLHDIETIRKIGEAFDIHPLVLEDILNTTQRPKMEVFEHSLSLIMKMIYPETAGGHISAEQMSFVLAGDCLLSFQEKEGTVFEPVRQRIRTGGTGFIRRFGADYLLCALADTIVDHYFVILEQMADEIETVDEALLKHPSPEILRHIHRLKKKTVFLRKAAWPLRDIFNAILRNDAKFIKTSVYPFFRDVHDHIIQVLEQVESFREMCSSMADLYQSSIGNKMNEVMKLLTIIATLFIPPTFVAGVYGMNFENMPELHAPWGYFAVIGIMVASIVSMLVYFRKKRWI